MLFGKWSFLKENLGDKIYKIQILARGLLLDNPEIIKNQYNPMYELMSFIHVKFRRNFESIDEKDLAEQISLWFYTYLLYDAEQKKKGRPATIKHLKKLFCLDEELHNWYMAFVKEANNYYEKRIVRIQKSGLI